MNQHTFPNGVTIDASEPIKTNWGGPAFPTENWEKMVPQTTGYSEGMTLRDYFAAKAMAAILQRNKNLDLTNHEALFTSEAAYFMADAMLKARGPI